MRASYLLIALASFAVASCGGESRNDNSGEAKIEAKQKKPNRSFGKAKLDSTNTDTLRASIGKVMEKLSQEDRMKAGAGLHLLLENASPSDVDIRELENADEEAEYIIDITADSASVLIDADRYVGNMIEYSEGRLNGKTASDLIEFRHAALDGAFENAMTKANTFKSQILPAKKKLTAQIESLKQDQKNLSDKRSALRAKGLTFVSDTNLKYKVFPKQRLIESEGGITVKNPTNKTIQAAHVWSEIWIKGAPNVKNYSSVQSALFAQNQTVPSGGTRSYNYVLQNRFRSMLESGVVAPNELSGYGTQIVVGQVKYTDGSEEIFYLSTKELQQLESFPKKIGNCESRIEQLDKTSLSIDTFLKQLSEKNIEALRGNPRFAIRDKC